MNTNPAPTFTPGMRVRFTCDIWEEANDHSPAGIWANRGTEATVTGEAARGFAAYVTPPGRPYGFGVHAHEIEVVEVVEETAGAPS